MKWCRLWTDVLDDVKMLQLTDYEFRMFIYLMCYASEVNSLSGEFQITFKSLSIRFHQRFNLFSRAIETFQRLGLVTINEGGFLTITNWSKRQFKSDDSYARVKKFREVSPKRNVSVTVNETVPDTDTDTDNRIKKETRAFVVPTIDEVSLYCIERGKGINPQAWMDHYTSNGWMVGKNKMKDWKASIRTWEQRGENRHGSGFGTGTGTVAQKAGRAKSDGLPYPVDHEF
jgi:hypothetical protein